MSKRNQKRKIKALIHNLHFLSRLAENLNSQIGRLHKPSVRHTLRSAPLEEVLILSNDDAPLSQGTARISAALSCFTNRFDALNRRSGSPVVLQQLLGRLGHARGRESHGLGRRIPAIDMFEGEPETEGAMRLLLLLLLRCTVLQGQLWAVHARR